VWCVVACSATAADGPPEKAPKPYIVLSGAKSHVKERSCLRVTSTEQWVELWQRHAGRKPEKEYNDFHNPAGVPNVNFEDCMVIAIFQGEGVNSAGLEPFSVEEDGDRIVFRFLAKSYQTMDKSDEVTVYGFFVLPRSNKAVLVEENRQTSLVGPRIWKERARFGAVEASGKK
jgi:hypothetical protein